MVKLFPGTRHADAPFQLRQTRAVDVLPTTMKAAVLRGKLDLTVEDRPMPRFGSHDVRAGQRIRVPLRPLCRQSRNRSSGMDRCPTTIGMESWISERASRSRRP